MKVKELSDALEEKNLFAAMHYAEERMFIFTHIRTLTHLTTTYVPFITHIVQNMLVSMLKERKNWNKNWNKKKKKKKKMMKLTRVKIMTITTTIMMMMMMVIVTTKKMSSRFCHGRNLHSTQKTAVQNQHQNQHHYQQQSHAKHHHFHLGRGESRRKVLLLKDKKQQKHRT